MKHALATDMTSAARTYITHTFFFNMKYSKNSKLKEMKLSRHLDYPQTSREFVSYLISDSKMNGEGPF